MWQGLLIIIVFLVIAALMMTKKIPTLLALPLMAIVICVIAGVPAVGVNEEGAAIGWLQTVLEAGLFAFRKTMPGSGGLMPTGSRMWNCWRS